MRYLAKNNTIINAKTSYTVCINQVSTIVGIIHLQPTNRQLLRRRASTNLSNGTNQLIVGFLQGCLNGTTSSFRRSFHHLTSNYMLHTILPFV